MLAKQSRKIIPIALGISFSLLYGSLFSSSKVVKKVELNLRDELIKARTFHVKPTQNLVLVNLDKKTFLKPEFQNNREAIYSEISRYFLSQNAGVIIINFPQKWRVRNARLNTIVFKNEQSSILELVNNNPGKIVLVSPVNRAVNSFHNQIANYSHLIGFDQTHQFSDQKDNLSYLLSTPQIQGFFEYENIEGKKPSNLSSPARRIHIQEKFIINSSQRQKLAFNSFAWLALKKYQKNFPDFNHDLSSIPKQLQINYWQPNTVNNQTFPVIHLKDLCSPRIENISKKHSCLIPSQPQSENPIRSFKNKIVIIGFLEGEELDVLGMQSPFGEIIPGIEIQANIISSLMTNSYYRTLSDLTTLLLYLVGGGMVGMVMTSIKIGNSLKYMLLAILVYHCLIMLAFFKGWMLPIISPLLAWIFTTITVILYLKNNQLIQDNQRQQRLIAEEEAMLSKAKQLIRGKWSDIHEYPLQELKVAMYELEFSSLSSQESELIINRLSTVGQEIRKHLTLDLDSELTLTPELDHGLTVAIQKKLKELTDSGKLKLDVKANLETIKEPKFKSQWISAREDIFRFFCEAINNVINHADLASQLSIDLFKKGENCVLVIEDNGKIPDNLEIEKKEGLGTKLLEEIADNLPEGIFERVFLPQGGVRVKLIWNHARYLE